MLKEGPLYITRSRKVTEEEETLVVNLILGLRLLREERKESKAAGPWFQMHKMSSM